MSHISQPTHQQDTTMPASGIDHEELFTLSEDIFAALNNVLNTDAPAVTRLALTSISLLRFIETAVLNTAAKDLDYMEEMRRLQQLELQAAKATEERMNQAMDAAVKTLAVDIAKSVCKFKQSMGGMVAKLEAREVLAEELDQRLEAVRAHQEQTLALVNESVELSSIGFVVSIAWNICCVADFEIDPVQLDRSSYPTSTDSTTLVSDRQHQSSSKNQSTGGRVDRQQEEEKGGLGGGWAS
jgi:hypothetical protein